MSGYGDLTMPATFPQVQSVSFRRRDSSPSAKPDFCFTDYDPDEVVEGRAMREHLRFAACYWHTMRNGLGDPFGAPTAITPWDDGTDSLDNARRRAEAFFEFLSKCRIGFYCFHDRDVAPVGASISQSEENLNRIADHLAQLQRATGVELLWGTANLFSDPDPKSFGVHQASRPTQTRARGAGGWKGSPGRLGPWSEQTPAQPAVPAQLVRLPG